MTPAFSDPRDSRGATLLLALGFMLVGSLIVMALLSWTGNGLFQATQSSNSLNFRYAANTAVQIRIQDLRYRYQPSQTFATCPGWPVTSSIAPAPTVSGGTSQQVTVYCSINTDETSANSRTITFDACPAVPSVTINGTTNGTSSAPSATVAVSSADLASLNAGMILATGQGPFAAGALIVSIDPTANTITLSQSVTTTGPVALSFDGACTSNPYLTAVVAYNDFDSSGNGNCSATAITTCGQNMTIESWDEPS